jgi:hypothetical protein
VNGSAYVDTYQIKLSVQRASATNRWTATLYKNGERFTGTVTSPTLTVTDNLGSALFTSAAMTRIGSTATYVVANSSLTVANKSYSVVFGGTWDSSARTVETNMSGSCIADVTAISNDTTAAANLESYCDGTTPQPVNATQISGSATAADVLELLHASAITTGTVGAGTFTTTTFQTDLNEVDDFHNKAIVVITSGSLAGQARVISDYANTNGAITVSTGFTSAPTTGMTFIVIGRSN